MHYKQNNKESKSYVQGLRIFGNTLPRGMRGILKKNGYNYSEIIKKWKILVGKDIANYSYPKSIKMNKVNSSGTLLLIIKRGHEINAEYSKDEIINKINSYFGYKLIGEIRLKVENYDLKKNTKNIQKKFTKNFKKKIDDIKDIDIKNSLHQLLSTIKND